MPLDTWQEVMIIPSMRPSKFHYHRNPKCFFRSIPSATRCGSTVLVILFFLSQISRKLLADHVQSPLRVAGESHPFLLGESQPYFLTLKPAMFDPGPLFSGIPWEMMAFHQGHGPSSLGSCGMRMGCVMWSSSGPGCDWDVERIYRWATYSICIYVA